MVQKAGAEVDGPDFASHGPEAAAGSRVDHKVGAQGLDRREGGHGPADRPHDVDAILVALAVEHEVHLGLVLVSATVTLGSKALMEAICVFLQVQVVDKGLRLGLHGHHDHYGLHHLSTNAPTWAPRLSLSLSLSLSVPPRRWHVLAEFQGERWMLVGRDLVEEF